MANIHRISPKHKKTTYPYRTLRTKLTELHKVADKKGISLNRLLDEITNCLLYNPKCQALRRRIR